MIAVSVEKNPEGRIVRFTVRGHADYDEAGRDIICAAASATAYGAIGWFEAIYNPDDVKSKRLFIEKDGLIKWQRPEETDEEKRVKGDAVLEAMVIGFKQIEYSYGRKYLIVKD